MEVNVHDKAKIVEVWMTNTEKNDPAIQSALKKLYAKYRQNKFTVAVFCSGSGDLYQNTRELLAYNKKHCAEVAVQQAQTADKSSWMVR